MKTNMLRIASAALVAALTPGLAWAQTCTPDARRIVDAIYRQVLERPSNGEGGSWVTQLSNGQLYRARAGPRYCQVPEHVRRFMSGEASPPT